MKNSKKDNLISQDFEIDGTVLVEYKGKGGDVVIPNGITEITAIADRYGGCYSAFSDVVCSGVCIRSVAVPKSVKHIDGLTFYMCGKLERITVDGQNGEYYAEGNCIIERSGKTLVTVIKNSVIPQDIKAIAYRALVCCGGETNLTYNGTKRQWNAIDKHVDWNESNRDCVIHCTDGDFTVDDAPFIIYNDCLCSYRGRSAKVIIPDNVTRVAADSWEGVYCFEFCGFVKSITVPKSLVSIDGSTFYGCFDLEEITVDSQNPEYYSQDNCVIERANKKLVVGCQTSVIPNDVKIIGFSAFYYCRGLTDITIPDAVTSIEQAAFCSCQNLASITIPSSVVAIGHHAFHDCLSLKTVYFGGSKTKWDKISIAEKNEALFCATICYFSETEPKENGNHWHYDNDGVTPVEW